jgi:hypothetical protein
LRILQFLCIFYKLKWELRFVSIYKNKNFLTPMMNIFKKWLTTNEDGTKGASQDGKRNRSQHAGIRFTYVLVAALAYSCLPSVPVCVKTNNRIGAKAMAPAIVDVRSWKIHDLFYS